MFQAWCHSVRIFRLIIPSAKFESGAQLGFSFESLHFCRAHAATLIQETLVRCRRKSFHIITTHRAEITLCQNMQPHWVSYF
jgi:hypothetical protein